MRIDGPARVVKQIIAIFASWRRAGLRVILTGVAHRAQSRIEEAESLAECQRARDALRQSEDQYRCLFDNAMDAVFLAMPDGKITAANPAACAMFGMSEEELCRVGRAGIIAQDDPRFPAALDARARTGRCRAELNFVRKDGTKFPAEVSSVIIGVEQAQSFVVLHDITQRKRTEQALRDSEERYHRLFEVEAAAILLVDFESGRLIDGNPAALALYGYTRTELLALHTTDVSAEPDKTLQAIAAGQKHVPIRWHRKKDGTVFPVEIAANYFDNGGRRTHVAVILDITERKRAEEEVRASREQLRALAARLQSVREEERTRIAREIHDVLAQELTRLKIDLVCLHRSLTNAGEAAAPETLAAQVLQMQQATEASMRCVQRIATELRPAVLDSLGLCAAVEWLVRDFQKRTGIQCNVSVPEDELHMDRDSATAVFRILQESLTNVLRHARATQLSVLLRQEGDQIILRVKDNGCGIPAETLNNPMSIGLAGMRERAYLLQGQLDISSQPGSQTTVALRLPICQNHNQTA